jgi:hypothetical protein
VVSVVLVLANNKHAPMVAAITGIPIAIGVSIVRGALSRSLPA